MSAERKKQVSSAGWLAALFAASAIIPLLTLPGIHEDFEYLVDGVFATTVSLAAIFVWFLKERFEYLMTVRFKELHNGHNA